ncbi:MAG: LuxR family transcriptional regulator [Verrucomicrobiota bacterium]|nr:LuxR family transcriptional regulator [Verrucomicrobiota bacterium]
MATVPGRRLEALSKQLLRLYALEDATALPTALANAANLLIPSANASYNQILNQQAGLSVSRSRGVKIPWVEDSPLLRNLHEHTVIQQLLKKRDGSVWKFGDFMTQREFHQTALYNEYYRRTNTQAQLCFGVHYSKEGSVIVAINHVGKDHFSEEDRALAKVMRSHFALIHRNVARMANLKTIAEGLGTAMDAARLGCVLLDNDGRRLHASVQSELLLQRYFPAEPHMATGLPETIHTWLQQQLAWLASPDLAAHPLKPLSVEGADARVVVRLRAGGEAILPMLFIEEEPLIATVQEGIVLGQTLIPPRPNAFDGSPAGLSPREVEVLTWLAQGKSNPEIAIILALSTRTVHKHMEHIFQKLGVENRTTAILRAFELGLAKL